MSDAAKHDDIEDVLSSIRRLVADGRAEPVPQADDDAADDDASEREGDTASDVDAADFDDLPDPGEKLLLTAALRVPDPEDPYRAIEPADDLDSVADAGASEGSEDAPTPVDALDAEEHRGEEHGGEQHDGEQQWGEENWDGTGEPDQDEAGQWSRDWEDASADTQDHEVHEDEETQEDGSDTGTEDFVAAEVEHEADHGDESWTGDAQPEDQDPDDRSDGGDEPSSGDPADTHLGSDQDTTGVSVETDPSMPDTFPLSQIADMVARLEGAPGDEDVFEATGQIVQFRRAGAEAEGASFAEVSDVEADETGEDAALHAVRDSLDGAAAVEGEEVNASEDIQATDMDVDAPDALEPNAQDPDPQEVEEIDETAGEFEPEQGDADWPEIGSTAAALSVAAARGVHPDAAAARTADLAEYAFTSERSSRISLADPLSAAPQPADEPQSEEIASHGADPSNSNGPANDHRLEYGQAPGQSFADDGFDADFDDEAEADMLDEEALRDLIRQVVREELQGALGQRITRNVRKMVRREIRLALAAETLE